MWVHCSACFSTTHIPFTCSSTGFFRKQGSGPFPAGAYVGLSLCSYSLHHCGRNRKTDINGQSQVKGRQILVLSPSGYLLSWVRVSVHDFWERGKPGALSRVLTVFCLLSFGLRVPGPQDGERGPAVCWVAGSFLQRDLGQCLPQPHG